MATPHKCPVCGGSGKLPMFNQYQTTAMIEENCHACLGSGVVWEPLPLHAWEIETRRSWTDKEIINFPSTTTGPRIPSVNT